LLCLGAGIFTVEPAFAEDTPFAWLYTTDVPHQGEVEVEQWLTYGHEKSQERYNALTGSTELEYGAFERLSLALYANYGWTRAMPLGPGAADAPTNSSRFYGFSGEAIYQLSDPSTNAFGLALYAEPSLQANERALEFKLLVQKNLLRDRLILGANANVEYAWIKDDARERWDRESALEFLLGASYRLSPQWSAGVEFVNENVYSGHLLGGAQAETSAFFFGPTVQYEHDGWWATLGLSRQLPWASNPGGGPELTANGYVTGTEQMRLRLRIGFEM
jgi:hypothetical protein